jgi:hypothetical protein
MSHEGLPINFLRLQALYGMRKIELKDTKIELPKDESPEQTLSKFFRKRNRCTTKFP